MDYVEDVVELVPDVYAGHDCDKIEPRWRFVGDDGEDFFSVSFLEARHHPPGTKIVVKVPTCPKCNYTAPEGDDIDWDSDIKCTNPHCDFSWKNFAVEKYS